ncbi:Qat anti-phage system TatD family nuclease QatD [Citrobacter koseri]|uniref:Qat anti-phage system TatD family nuclease QatD n=1 Tax=Citrobacter koseri TaxID=545 RepID=UPI0019081FEF|nr:Qat anti-phage system TatD family nuclease QatD [Citrobacter koseri]MBJ8866107.1 TatD family hydrolase [Citrobacter koseri]MBL4562494.1 TatD family hydrolase [Citrobacter koseri]
MIDFHCHIDLYPDPRKVIEECKKRGLYILSVTTTPSAWEGTSSLAHDAPRIRTALGLHPQLAHQRKTELPLFEKYIDQTRYVGEIGLDGTPEFKKNWADQIQVFTRILDICESAGGKVLSLHSRRATSSVLDEIERRPKVGTPILHWFSGTKAELNRAKDLDCWYSIGPVMLNGHKGRQLASLMPKDRVLIESDGPFAQIDGRSACPWDTYKTLSQLTEIWGKSLSEVESQLLSNLKILGQK